MKRIKIEWVGYIDLEDGDDADEKVSEIENNQPMPEAVCYGDSVWITSIEIEDTEDED